MIIKLEIGENTGNKLLTVKNKSNTINMKWKKFCNEIVIILNFVLNLR